MVEEIFDLSGIPQQGKVILKMETRWCHPCKQIKPFYENYSKKYSEHITFIRTDAEASEDISEKYIVQGFPTFIFINNGKEHITYTGSDPNILLSKIVDFVNI